MTKHEHRKFLFVNPSRKAMQSRAVALALMVMTLSLSGCFGEEEVLPPPVVEEEEDPRIFVTDKTGASIDVPALDMTFQFSDVGETGKEPSIGITSSGCIFFIAMEKVMRSCDGGLAWEETQDPVMCSPTTSDPYGWVDPITDRVFGVQMIGLETSWICWSDDDGETWLGNPHDSGTTPINDHIKLASGLGLIAAMERWANSQEVSMKLPFTTVTTNSQVFSVSPVLMAVPPLRLEVKSSG